MRATALILIVVFALAAAGASLMTVVIRAGITRIPDGRPAALVRFEVAPGEPFVSVVDRLAQERVVGSPWTLRVYASLKKCDRRIQWGTYEFSPAERPIDVLGKLVRGDVFVAVVTVPEGYTIWDIAGAFRVVAVDSVEMLAAAQDESTRGRRHVPAPSLEGYLFPDTYRVPWGASPSRIVDMMLARLDEVFDHSLLQRAADMDFTPHQVLTLASIIEAETRVPEERPIVSAVYHNRLKRGMRLEADPTVAYAMGGYHGRLMYADLNVDSPYNTYRHGGLPQGPICSPGEASIRAALYPDTASQALYFVARGDGSHIFSQTLREHSAAAASLRRSRRSQGTDTVNK